ncbi:hypothetical protein AB0899_12150 [Streptomyces sp. NPDC007002]|uniref:hypothetical protein n=1 Tax=Streptomyces sp. NPDC007002 TaxID=3156910 RepID=UPI003453F26C
MRTRGTRSGACAGEESRSPSTQATPPATARAAPATGRLAHSNWNAMTLMPTATSTIAFAPSPPKAG